MSLEKIVNTDKVELSSMGDTVTIPAEMWVDVLDYAQQMENALIGIRALKKDGMTSGLIEVITDKGLGVFNAAP